MTGWDAAVLAAVVVLCALVLANGDTGGELGGGFASIAVLAVVWFAVARRAAGADSGWDPAPTGAAVPVSMGLFIVLGGVATAANPSLATMQAILFPLLWMLARTMRGAVVANLLLAVSVVVGFLAGLGVTFAVLREAVVIEVISVAGSLAIGFWIARISRENAEHQRLLGELRDTQDRLAAASRDAGMVVERERLSRELHDTIAQDLTGLVLLTERVRRELVTGEQAVGETLELLEDSARAALAETRALVASSAPVGLVEGGLGAALDRLGSRIEREAGIRVAVSAPGSLNDAASGSGSGSRSGPDVAGLTRDEEVVLLRCAQEALSNVRRHASASHVEVSLAVSAEAAVLRVVDDGRGFDPSVVDSRASRTGFGLDGLAERLAIGGGSLSVESGEGRGTMLTATLPRVRVSA